MIMVFPFKVALWTYVHLGDYTAIDPKENHECMS